MKKKVLINFCEAGQGHIVTAEAIAQALEKKYSDSIEIDRYYFKNSDKKSLVEYEKFAIREVKTANKNKMHLRTQLLAMKFFGEEFSLNLSFNVAFNKFTKEMTEVYVERKPDAIVNTYFAPHHIACLAKKNSEIDSIVIAYDPDHNVHGWWDKNCDMFITNNELAKKEAIEERGFNPEQVETVNFIARQQIVNCNESKEYFREKRNFPLDKFTVVLADGAYASANLEKFTDELIKIKKPITVIPLCGKNDKLYKKYTKLVSKVKENVTLIPLRYENEVQEVLKSADLFITKAGPNAITDCVFLHTPIMTNFYSGAIEETSSKLFTETYGMGIYCPNKLQAKKLVESYIENPSLLDEYVKNTYKVDKNKNGAEEIADLIAKKLGVI